MGWIPICVGLAVLARLAAQLALDALNQIETRRNEAHCPEALAGVLDAAEYSKSVRYALAKGRLSLVASSFDAAVLLALLVSGALPWWWARADALAPSAAWSGALSIVLAMGLLWVVGLPLSWWAQFHLEERFGFNRSTPALWAVDHAKFALLGLGIGFPAAWAVLALAGWAGLSWWVWGFALLFGLELLMVVAFPKLILPLFNRLSPLPDGDRSKRSGHSNAFFTGFGRFRRIVLLDTLIAQLSPAELEAVLAHEIGHYKCGHVPKALALSALLQFGGFALVAWLMRTHWIAAAFGLPEGALAPVLLLMALFGGVVTFWFVPFGSWLSRRHEFQADAFARKVIGSSEPMVGALRTLSRRNLSNLTPHPLYSAVFYSHPTLSERERALRSEPQSDEVIDLARW